MVEQNAMAVGSPNQKKYATAAPLLFVRKFFVRNAIFSYLHAEKNSTKILIQFYFLLFIVLQTLFVQFKNSLKN
jgi:hypothetical protein